VIFYTYFRVLKFFSNEKPVHRRVNESSIEFWVVTAWHGTASSSDRYGCSEQKTISTTSRSGIQRAKSGLFLPTTIWIPYRVCSPQLSGCEHLGTEFSTLQICSGGFELNSVPQRVCETGWAVHSTHLSATSWQPLWRQFIVHRHCKHSVQWAEVLYSVTFSRFF